MCFKVDGSVDEVPIGSSVYEPAVWQCPRTWHLVNGRFWEIPRFTRAMVSQSSLNLGIGMRRATDILGVFTSSRMVDVTGPFEFGNGKVEECSGHRRCEQQMEDE